MHIQVAASLTMRAAGVWIEKGWELVDGCSALSSRSSFFLYSNLTLKLSAFGRIRLKVEP